MFIPLGTDRPLKRPTLINHWLIGVNVLVYIVDVSLLTFAPGAHGEVISALALSRVAFEPWALATYAFLHAGFLHLLFNMLFLFVFGPNVEDRFGRAGYLVFYLAGAAAAGLAHMAAEPASVVGASGAIAAVTGAYLILFPKTSVRTLIFIFGIFDVPAAWFIGFAIAKDLFFHGFAVDSGVAYVAHLGGYGFGAVVAFSLLAMGALSREPYDLFSLGKQARRRRQFRELTSRGADPWAGRPPGRGWRARSHDDSDSDELSKRRAEISRLHSSGQIDAAADAYLELLGEREEATLSRRAQLEVANHIFQRRDYESARQAYELFLRSHPRDPEGPGVRLMLGLIYTRYIPNLERARELLGEARGNLRDPDQRSLLEGLLSEIGEDEESRT